MVMPDSPTIRQTILRSGSPGLKKNSPEKYQKYTIEQ